MSVGIHGNAEAQEKDRIIRAELLNEGYSVISITVQELDDKKAMISYFKKIAKFLVGREFAQKIADDQSWF